MADGGWIKLHRRILNWEWWGEAKTVQIFVTLLLKANHEDKMWRGILVKRGQLITSLASLKQITKLSTKAIRTALKRLKISQEVAIETTNKYSKISIVNYDTYQVQDTDWGKQKGKERASKGHAKGQATGQQTRIEELEEVKNKREQLTLLAPGLLVKPDFEQKSKEKFNSQFNGRPNWFQEEIEKASDWTLSKARKHRDAEAFLRNWFRRAAANSRLKSGQVRTQRDYREMLK